MPRKISIAGEKIGRLVVVSPSMKAGKKTTWLCRCDCGKEVVVRTSDLRSGKSRSCGCLHLEVISTHGHASHKGRSHEYLAWSNMKSRCLGENGPRFDDYGGRGIGICERWLHSFESFLADMGPRPSKDHSVERIENHLGYSPENCRWATRREQQANRRTSQKFSYRGRLVIMAELSRLSGVSETSLRYRVFRMGLSPDEAVAYRRKES